MRRALFTQRKKENIMIGDFSHISTISYGATNKLSLKPTKSIVLNKQYRIKFTLNYNIRANDTTTPSELRIEMGAVNSYATIFPKITNASTVDYISNTVDFDFVFTSKLNVDDASATFQKGIVIAKHGYKNGTVSISNVSMTEV
jgi:hypothetical protein